MNGMGRQGQRSGGVPAAQHQRQYSDNFLETSSTSSNGRWLQSTGLQHLQASNNSLPPLQDYNFYGGAGGGGQGPWMYRNLQRGLSGGSDFFAEPTTPPVGSRRKQGEESPNNEFSPGLLDLHSFDTELLPELPVPSLYESSSLYDPVRGRAFDDSEPYISNETQTGRTRGLPENKLMKSFSVDKEKINSVAKIKVV